MASPQVAGSVPAIEMPGWLATPRPNGSRALGETAEHIRSWLENNGVAPTIHIYRARPYFNEALGLWLMAGSVAVAACVVSGRGAAAFACAVLLVALGVAEVLLNRPLVSRVRARQQANVIVTMPPVDGGAGAARQEVVLSAHYDTKTEALDHDKRRVFTATLGPAMALCLATGAAAWAPEALGDVLGGAIPVLTSGAQLGAAGVLLFCWGMGLNLATGRFLPRQSTGAVDDGGACAVLLEMARRLATGAVRLERTRVTLAWFSGEEVTMQGARAWVRSRQWALPARAVNLEAVGQDGGYFTWDADGTVMARVPTDTALTAALSHACLQVTGRPLTAVPEVNSDALAFLEAGIPAAGMGSMDTTIGAGGLHGPLDAPTRVYAERLSESVTILETLLAAIDRPEARPGGETAELRS